MTENGKFTFATSREDYIATEQLNLPAQENQIGYYFSPEQLPEHLRNLTASVGKLIHDDGQIGGSCFVIEYAAKKYIVSAYHAFFSDSVVTSAVFPSGETLTIYGDEVSSVPQPLIEDDICLIRKEDIDSPGLMLGEDVEIQKDITTLLLGYPRSIDMLSPSFEPLASIGTVIETAIQPGGLISGCANDLIRTNTRAQDGNSGGPLLNEDGYVLAVLIQGFPPRPTIDFNNDLLRETLRISQELALRSRHESLAVPINKILPYME